MARQMCPYSNRSCYKVRKSDPTVAIGTCTFLAGKDNVPLVICPSRLTERRQVFTDCMHLLTLHEPGNELHLVSEVEVPGGSVDFFLVSARDMKVRDFVGIELQALDTTGTLWPERQRLLQDLGVPRNDNAADLDKPFGVNWKHTEKTILVQLNHKIATFESLAKKLVLVVQDTLLTEMTKEFTMGHLNNPARIGDSMHFHPYSLRNQDGQYSLQLGTRLSTDAEGVERCLGLQREARVELVSIVQRLEAKMSPATLLRVV